MVEFIEGRRQTGKTTAALAECGPNSLYVVPTQHQAYALKHRAVEPTVPAGCKVISPLASTDELRGHHFSTVVFDDCDYVLDFGELQHRLVPFIEPDAKIIYVVAADCDLTRRAA